MSASNCTENCCLLVLVVDGLSTEEGSTALRELHYDWSADLGSGLEDGVDGAGSCAVECWNGKALCLRMQQQIPSDITSDHTSLHAGNVPKCFVVTHFRHGTKHTSDDNGRWNL